MNETTGVGQPAPIDSFSANVNVDGATAYISAPSLTLLSALVARLKGTTLATSTGLTADEKAAVLGNGSGTGPSAGKRKPAASETAGSPQGTASAGEAGNAQGGQSSTATTTSTEASASAARAEQGSPASTPAAAAVVYDDVKKLVNALYAIEPKHAVDALAEFGVKNGKELKAEQWADFVQKAAARLGALKVAA